MQMRFVFVDETGDLGELSKGASPYFGMALLSVKDKDYEATRRLLSQVHWLCGTATSINLSGGSPVRALNLLRGLQELARNGIVCAAGLYINKKDYGGRYMTWSDVDVPSSEWRYYLRNYLLRHSLEFHFSALGVMSEPIDLILDRILLSESQRKNTLEYLNSKTAVPLRQPFGLPHVEYLTIADSEYVGGLEIAHVLADVLREFAKRTISEEVRKVSDFMRIEHFVGHKKATK